MIPFIICIVVIDLIKNSKQLMITSYLRLVLFDQMPISKEDVETARNQYQQEKKAIDNMIEHLIQLCATCIKNDAKNEKLLQQVNFKHTAQILFTEARQVFDKNQQEHHYLYSLGAYSAQLQGNLDRLCNYVDEYLDNGSAGAKINVEMGRLKTNIEYIMQYATDAMIELLKAQLPQRTFSWDHWEDFIIDEKTGLPKNRADEVNITQLTGLPKYLQDKHLQQQKDVLIDAIRNKLCPAYHRMESFWRQHRKQTEHMDLTSKFVFLM